MHKDDVVELLVQRGWVRGASGDLYFPGSSKPHLHVGIQHGFHDFDNLYNWFTFLVVSRPPGEGANTTLVRSGAVCGNAVQDLGSGEIKNQAMALTANGWPN